jgi:trimethylamine monooxygenase
MLWKGIVHPDNTNLLFVGMPDQYYTFTMFFAQAMFIKGCIEGKVSYPSKEEMAAHVKEWQDKEDVAHASGDHAEHHRLQLAHTNDACEMVGFKLRDDGDLICQWQDDRHRDILK